MTGFYGTYRGPEIVLGIIDPGADQGPGERYEDAMVRPALGGIFQLAERERISADDLRTAGHLCPCAAQGEEAAWLRGISVGQLVETTLPPPTRRVVNGPNDRQELSARLDRMWLIWRRRASAGLLRRATGGGPYADIELAEAWRGLMLRNRSVGAWRNIWSWIVQELAETLSATALATAFTAELPAEWSVGDLTANLPPGIDGDELCPSKRSCGWPSLDRTC